MEGLFVCMFVNVFMLLLSTKTIVPSWMNKLSIVSTHRQCKYNVDDTFSTYLTVKDEGEVILLEVSPSDHTPLTHSSVSFDLILFSFRFVPFLPPSTSSLPDGLGGFTQSSSPLQNMYLKQLPRENSPNR